MKERLARILYPYGSVRTVLRGPVRGKKFVVEKGIGMTYGLGFEGAAPSFYTRWVRPGTVVYDIGGNKGQMMLLFASLVGAEGRVISFEPAPSEFESLLRHIEINRLSHFVEGVRAAVADTSGELRFTYSPDRPTQGKLGDVEPTYVNRGAAEFAVPGITLDDFVRTNPPPDFVKVDVEGAAAAVFRGAQRMLSDYSPSIFIELHGPEEQAGVRDELLSLGYVAETLDGQRVDDPTAGWYSPLICRKPAAR